MSVVNLRGVLAVALLLGACRVCALAELPSRSDRRSTTLTTTFSRERCERNLAKLDLPQPVSLIKNGGFEHGDGGPWTFRGKRPADEPSGNVQRSDELAHSGRYALRIDSAGVSASVKYLTARQVASSKGRGRTIRVSFWSFLQTAPHANFDPVQLTVRQYRESALAKHDTFSVYNDTGEWAYGEKTISVIPDLKRMDLLFVVRNTSANKPAVLFVDDVRCETLGVQPLTASLPVPDLAAVDRWLPMNVLVAEEVLAKAGCRLDLFVTRRSATTVLKRFSRAPKASRDRWAMDLAGIPAGAYEARLFLSANGAGPVARMDLPFLVYDGPFE